MQADFSVRTGRSVGFSVEQHFEFLAGELDSGEFFTLAVGFAAAEPRQRFVEMLAALTDETSLDLLDPHAVRGGELSLGLIEDLGDIGDRADRRGNPGT